ncbi:MAG TPA: HD domain-containing phosphohydrolase [Nitriliruptorales bacterium]|nr:HD domain-containing phosphohydrolase [Nitriliruptorales bacterium]
MAIDGTAIGAAGLAAARLDARILVVDDEPANVRLLERILVNDGYRNVASRTDSNDAVELLRDYPVDLLLLDLHMPGLDGFAVLERLAGITDPDDYVPTLVLTADVTTETKHRALASGARDFLTKPFDPIEVSLRVANLLDTRLLHHAARAQNVLLEHRVRERTAELEQARIELLRRLSLAAEFRDDETYEHTERVGVAAALLGDRVGLDAADVESLRRAAPLHDIGKIGVPDEILLKPGPLTAEEYARMKAHTTIGALILGGSSSPVLRMGETIALTHHERWDGSGYPGRLAGEQIALVGRIVSVTDVFDALTHERPYKAAWPVDEAVAELERGRGTQFDPRLVDLYIDQLARDGSG